MSAVFAAAVVCVAVTFLFARAIGSGAFTPRRPRLVLDEAAESVSYEIPLSLREDEPIPYTFTDAGVALAWSQAAAAVDEPDLEDLVHADDPESEPFEWGADDYYADRFGDDR